MYLTSTEVNFVLRITGKSPRQVLSSRVGTLKCPPAAGFVSNNSICITLDLTGNHDLSQILMGHRRIKENGAKYGYNHTLPH